MLTGDHARQEKVLDYAIVYQRKSRVTVGIVREPLMMDVQIIVSEGIDHIIRLVTCHRSHH